MEDSFITTSALFRGFGFSGWQGTTAEEALKVALICSKQLYVPLSDDNLKFIISKFSERECISKKLIEDAFLPEPVNPSDFDPSFIQDIKEFLLRGFMDKRIHAEDRQYYLLLLATVINAEENGSYEWYDHLFHTGQFFMLNFIDAIIWDRYSMLHHDITLIASDDAQLDYRILRRYLSRFYYKGKNDDCLKQIIELEIPDFGKIPWSAIFKLRKDKRIESFRNHIDRISFEKNEKSAAKCALDEICAAVSDISPNVRRVALEGAVSNIPLPIPVNPLSLGASLVALVRSITYQKKNMWLTFVQQLRKESKIPLKNNFYESNQPFVGPETRKLLNEGYLFLTNYPGKGFVKNSLNNKPIVGKDKQWLLSFKNNSSIDIFVKKSAKPSK
jgi:hypothetical protein